jgi:uncharacterized GH25 family protein
MEEPEVPTEHLQEEIHDQVSRHSQSWTLGVALSSALLASLAAVASLTAGHYANEAMMLQVESATMELLQSKGIKEARLKRKADILEALGKPISDTDKEKAAEYRTKIKSKVAETLRRARASSAQAPGVGTKCGLFQIAIAVGTFQC